MNSVGFVLWVGFIEVLLIGMEIRWISVSVRLIVSGVKVVGECGLVVLRMMVRNLVVRMVLVRNVVLVL